MSTNEPESKRRIDGAVVTGFLVCLAAVGIVFIGGANPWTAIAVSGLCFMGLGIAFLVLRKS